MLSYAEVFYEGARSQLLPTSIVLRAVWCYLSLREEGEGARRERGRGMETRREKGGPDYSSYGRFLAGHHWWTQKQLQDKAQ